MSSRRRCDQTAAVSDAEASCVYLEEEEAKKAKMAEVVELQKLKVCNTIIWSIWQMCYMFISDCNVRMLLLTERVIVLLFNLTQ